MSYLVRLEFPIQVSLEQIIIPQVAAKIAGAITEENVKFILTFTATANKPEQELVLVRGAVSLLALYKHKANFKRLLAGTENRFSWSKNSTKSKP